MVTKTPQRKKHVLTATKAKHRKVLTNLAKNGGKLAEAIRDTGLYSEEVARNPSKITNSRSWNELVEEELPDELLTEVHTGLLKATRLDHMVFPLGPRTNKQKKTIQALPKKLSTILDAEMQMQETELSDEDIVAMLAEVNCTVRKIVHGETARHVYFWAADNLARDKALDKGYKLKGRYGDEGVPPPRGNIYNFIFGAEVQEKIRVMEGDIKKMLVQPNQPTS